MEQCDNIGDKGRTPFLLEVEAHCRQLVQICGKARLHEDRDLLIGRTFAILNGIGLGLVAHCVGLRIHF